MLTAFSDVGEFNIAFLDKVSMLNFSDVGEFNIAILDKVCMLNLCFKLLILLTAFSGEGEFTHGKET